MLEGRREPADPRVTRRVGGELGRLSPIQPGELNGGVRLEDLDGHMGRSYRNAQLALAAVRWAPVDVNFGEDRLQLAIDNPSAAQLMVNRIVA
jgi:hypothetical protein